MRLARLLTLSVGILAARAASADALALLVQEGDLVFQRSRSAQSEAVALATHSALTHMGLVLFEDGKFWVYEAVQPVQRTPLEAWVARGVDGKVVVRRLRDAASVLTPKVVRELKRSVHGFLGKPYDLQFRWDDDELYCSELVYKAYERAAGVRLGRLQRVAELDLASPTVQRKLRQRYGKKLQRFEPREQVITPQSMFDDARLVTVVGSAPTR